MISEPKSAGKVCRRETPACTESIREGVIKLVTFSCPAYADITMFDDVAVRLLKLMGHSGKVPGGLLAEDDLAAPARLQAEIEAEKLSPEVQTTESGDGEPAVSLPQRTFPLIDLLTTAVEADCYVIWDSGN